MIFQGEKQLKEFEGKLNPETASKIQGAIDRLKEAVKNDNATEMKSAIEQYNTTWNEASSQMYSQAKDQGAPGADPGAGSGAGPGPQQQQGPGPEPQAEQKDDKTVENADFEVMDDDDKKDK